MSFITHNSSLPQCRNSSPPITEGDISSRQASTPNGLAGDELRPANNRALANLYNSTYIRVG
ncbi:MAG TPA: hypothetical protein V6D33_10270 [Cyanophyceae cyanobacterium]